MTTKKYFTLELAPPVQDMELVGAPYKELESLAADMAERRHFSGGIGMQFMIQNIRYYVHARKTANQQDENPGAAASFAELEPILGRFNVHQLERFIELLSAYLLTGEPDSSRSKYPWLYLQPTHVSEKETLAGHDHGGKMTSSEEVDFRFWSVQWLESFYKQTPPEEVTVFLNFHSELKGRIESILGRTRKFVGMGIFIEELVSFIDKKTRTERGTPEFDNFLNVIYDALLAGSGFMDYIPAGQLLWISSKAARNPETHRICFDAGEFLTQQLGFEGKQIATGLETAIDRHTVPEVLDLINNLNRIGIENVCKGGYGKGSYNEIVGVVQSIIKKTNSPWVKHAANVAIEDLKLKEGINFEGENKSEVKFGRYSPERIKQRDKHLRYFADPNMLLERHDYLEKIASDYVAVKDVGHMIKFAAPLPVSGGENDEVSKLEFKSVWDIGERAALNPYKSQDTEQTALLLQHLHRPEIKFPFEEYLGIEFEKISLRSQVQFIHFLQGRNTEEFTRLAAVLKDCSDYKYEILNSFLVVAERPDSGMRLLDLTDQLHNSPDLAKKVFEACNLYIDRAWHKAGEVLAGLRLEFPRLELSEDMVAQALISRGKDFLFELSESIAAGLPAEESSKNFIEELNLSNYAEHVVRSQFKAMAELLTRDNINLSQFESQQALVLESLLRDLGTRRITLGTLARMGKLEPIPEIHWRVDRTMEEYNRRTGVDVAGFLKEKGLQKPRQKLLEIGPGSGLAKKERAQVGLAELYNELALSDKVYYPIAPIIGKLVNFEKLEKAIGRSLDSADRSLLADLLYKCMVIMPGQTSRDDFEYNSENLHALVGDINSLKKILSRVGEYLRVTDEIPQHISTRDPKGNVVYPYKIKTSEQSEGFRSAKASLEQGVESFLRDDWQHFDYHELIDAFFPNVMIGDISDIGRLLPGQLDVELGIRSTVYKRGEEYIQFLTTLFSRLADNGVAIDDSIRDNDGWYYRVAEVWEAQKRLQGENLEVLVVLGPGFEGEDARQDLVPLALVATKNGSSRDVVKKYLQTGCRIVTLEEVIKDTLYLKTLDVTGRTAEQATYVIGSGDSII